MAFNVEENRFAWTEAELGHGGEDCCTVEANRNKMYIELQLNTTDPHRSNVEPNNYRISVTSNGNPLTHFIWRGQTIGPGVT